MSDSQTNSFTRAAITNSYSLSGIGLPPQNDLTGHFQKELEDRMALNSPETRARRHEFFGISGADPEDYREELIHIDSRRPLLAGIRHMNANPDAPFIDAWPGWVLESGEDIHSIREAVLPKFRVFRPGRISLWLRAGSTILQGGSHKAESGQHVLAATASALSRAPKPDRFREIELHALKDERFYDQYVRDYADFHRDRPDLKERVPAVDIDDMRAAVAEGLIFRATVGGQEAGLIAAKNDSFIGKPGVYFLEILLKPRFRGKRFAPALQRRFMETVSSSLASDETVFWGTIDSRNPASLNTALRTGRSIVSTEWFFPLEP